MWTILKSQTIPAMLALILFAVAINASETGMRWYARHQPAIEWQGVTVLTPSVAPGGVLSVVYKARINRQCPSDLRSFIEAADGTVPVRYPTISGGYRKPGNMVDVPVAVMIPKQSDPSLAPFRPGPHIYRTMATRYCADGVEDDDKIPDAPFTLE